MCLVWTLGILQNSSCQTLDGEAAPRVYQYQRTLEESGEWVIFVVVQRSDGGTSMAKTKVLVVSTEPDIEP